MAYNQYNNQKKSNSKEDYFKDNLIHKSTTKGIFLKAYNYYFGIKKVAFTVYQYNKNATTNKMIANVQFNLDFANIRELVAMINNNSLMGILRYNYAHPIMTQNNKKFVPRYALKYGGTRKNKLIEQKRQRPDGKAESVMVSIFLADSKEKDGTSKIMFEIKVGPGDEDFNGFIKPCYKTPEKNIQFALSFHEFQMLFLDCEMHLIAYMTSQYSLGKIPYEKPKFVENSQQYQNEQQPYDNQNFVNSDFQNDFFNNNFQ